jgi:hypothetical protein
MISFLFTSCEQDEDHFEKEIESFETATNKTFSNTRIVNAKEIPEILNILKSNTGTATTASNKLSYKKSHIKLNNIIEVKGKNGRINYTFPIQIEGQQENEFYNLIVHKTATGEIKDPYIKRYVVFPDALENFLAHNRDFRYFKGTFFNYWFDDFF